MKDAATIRCHGCGAEIDLRGSYPVYDERACSAECVKRILLRDFSQATDRLADYYAENVRSSRVIQGRSSR